MTDPEDSTELLPRDLAEVEVDEAAESTRPADFEADPADVADQRLDVVDDDDRRDDDVPS